MRQIRYLLVILALVIGGVVHASPGNVGNPQILLQNITDDMIEALNANKEAIRADINVLYPLVDRILLPHVDFNEMSRRVFATHWAESTPEQRQRFAQQFSRLLIRTYATAFRQFQGDEEIEFTGVRRSRSNPNNLVEVTSLVQQRGAADIPVSYQLIRETGGEWKIYDVTVDGISLVRNFRAQLRDRFNESNGVDKVIADLTERNQTFEAAQTQ